MRLARFWRRRTTRSLAAISFSSGGVGRLVASCNLPSLGPSRRRDRGVWLHQGWLDSELHAAHGSGYTVHVVDVVSDDVADAVEGVGFDYADDVVGTGYSVDLDCLIELFQRFEDGVAFASLGFN